MALSQVYTAVSGDLISAARWNNEFGNIYSNGTDVAFPLTKNVSLAGFTLTLDSANATTIVSPSTAGLVYTPGAKAGTPGTAGSHFNQAAATFTDNNTAIAGTAATWNSHTLRQPTLAATNTGVTTTNASTLYIENAPAAGTNETLTNAYAIRVDDGKVQLDGALQVEGTTTLNGSLVVASATMDTLNPYALTNLNINVTMSGSAVTVALKTDANADATSANPIRVRFRNATLATSGTTNVNITAALSMSISSGSTLDTVSGELSRVYIGLLNNAGTAELFVYNPLTSTLDLRGLSESALISTTAEGGAGAADSAQVAYSTTARTSVAFRIIGFFESNQATAGTWNTAAATVQELQPWMPRTGHIVQCARNQSTTVSVSAVGSGNVMPWDDTLPQYGETNLILTQALTPLSTLHLLRVSAQAWGTGWTDASLGTGASAWTLLFRDAAGSALTMSILGATGQTTSTVHSGVVPTLHYTVRSGTVASTSFSINLGSDFSGAARQWSVLQSIATTQLGVGSFSTTDVGFIQIEEIMV